MAIEQENGVGGNGSLSAERATILVCDDERNMRQFLVDLFEEEGWAVDACASGEEALLQLRDPARSFPVMLLDLSLPGIDGFEVLRTIRHEGIETNVIVITAFGTIEAAVRAMREGASDFVVKPFDTGKIVNAVRRALESRDLLAQVELSHPVFEGADGAPIPIIGEDVRLQSIFNVIHRIANLSTSVLIQGESGTGKELVAQAIHYNSSRRDAPFVAVNCGALPENLLESEFFGHERGAFTGAHALQRGKFELADGGTMFLDEVGEMPLALQVKFLRVLQEQRFTRVGGDREIETDVRIIAATNRNLSEAVKARQFREDLYYRLNVLPIQLPALRERRGDIPMLIKFFNRRFAERHRLDPIRVDAALMERISNADWPGNIRQLQNAVEKAVILQDAEAVLEANSPINAPPPDPGREMISMPAPYVREDSTTSSTFSPGDNMSLDLGSGDEIRPLGDVAADAQRGAVIRALRICGGNKSEAAKRLGVSYKTLFNKINELDISISTRVK